MSIIFTYGDSITYGAWDVENSGWHSHLRKYLDIKQNEDSSLYFLTYNLGIPGETTEGLLKRFEAETNARLRGGNGGGDYIFIFEFGANDSALVRSTGLFRVSSDKFQENLEEVIEKAKTFSSKIILINITPVIEEITIAPKNTDKSRLNKYVEEYNKKISSVAQNFSLPLVDVYIAFKSEEYKKLLDSDDGLHPNNKGHELIFAEVKKEIDKLI